MKISIIALSLSVTSIHYDLYYRIGQGKKALHYQM